MWVRLGEICMSPAVNFVAWIRISSWFWGLVCFLNACWAFMQVYCFLQNISIALHQSLVTNENDSIYFIYTQLSCAHRKGGLEAKFTQNSPLLCSFGADAFLWSAAVFCLVAWLFCRMHHTSWTHCVIPFPSAALPSEHTAAGFTSCSCYCLLLPCFQSKLGDPHCFQEPLKLGCVGVFNQNIVLYKNNLCVHVTPLSVCLNVSMWTFFDASLLWSLLQDATKLALSFRSC